MNIYGSVYTSLNSSNMNDSKNEHDATEHSSGGSRHFQCGSGIAHLEQPRLILHVDAAAAARDVIARPCTAAYIRGDHADFVAAQQAMHASANFLSADACFAQGNRGYNLMRAFRNEQRWI